MPSNQISVIDETKTFLPQSTIRNAIQLGNTIHGALEIIRKRSAELDGGGHQIELQVWGSAELEWEEKYALPLIRDFFPIAIRYSTDVGINETRHTVKFSGPDEIAIASKIVFNYLAAIFYRLWVEHRRITGIGNDRRRAYYAGLQRAISDRLRKEEKCQTTN